MFHSRQQLYSTEWKGGKKKKKKKKGNQVLPLNERTNERTTSVTSFLGGAETKKKKPRFECRECKVGSR